MLVAKNFEDSTQSSQNERDSSTNDECTCMFVLNSHKCVHSVGFDSYLNIMWQLLQLKTITSNFAFTHIETILSCKADL